MERDNLLYVSQDPRHQNALSQTNWAHTQTAFVNFMTRAFPIYV